MNKLIFDIGATNTKFALMSDVEGEILKKGSLLTNYLSKEAYINTMYELAKEYIIEADEIAISTNGRMKQDDITYRAYTQKILENFNLKEEVEKKFNLPVKIINDGYAAALGEWWMGAGEQTNNVLVLVLGSGLGGGLILNGELYKGSKKNSTAVFNMINGFTNGNHNFVGINTAFTFLLYKLSMVKQISMEEMTGEKFFQFVEEKDSYALKFLNDYCEDIAAIAYNAQNLLDLDKVVLTGGLANRDIIIDGVNKKLKNIYNNYFDSSLGEIADNMLFDKRDINVEVVKGKLTQNANFYGAYLTLYHKSFNE